MILMVNLDLKGPSASYTPLFDLLKSQGPWSHYMKATWLINTAKTPKQLNDEARVFLSEHDFMLICTLVKPYQGWLPEKVWEWIHKQEEAETLNMFSAQEHVNSSAKDQM